MRDRMRGLAGLADGDDWAAPPRGTVLPPVRGGQPREALQGDFKPYVYGAHYTQGAAILARWDATIRARLQGKGFNDTGYMGARNSRNSVRAGNVAGVNGNA